LAVWLSRVARWKMKLFGVMEIVSPLAARHSPTQRGLS
jgi:hypothetical protein